MTTKPIRILYIDDNPLDRELVRDALEKEHGGFELIEAASRAEFVSALAKNKIDLVLSDFNILGFEGLQVIDAVRAKDADLPVIIVTGTGSEETAVQAMKRGAVDYVIKTPEHIQRLPNTIHVVLNGRQLENERIQAEEALRASEERFRNLVEDMNEGLGVQDKNGLITFMNRRACEMLGYEIDELIGKPVTSMFDEENQQILIEQMALQPKGERKNYEIAWLRKDGRRIDTIIAPRSRFDENGEFVESVAVFTDITQRKKVEETLRQSQLRSEGIIQSVNGVFWEADAQTFEFTFVSAQAERILGYPVARWLEEPTFWRDHLHPEDRDAAVAYCLAATARLEAHQFEYRMIAADGRAVWLRDIVTVIAESGRPSKLLGILVDITESKQAEETLRDNVERLRLAVQASNVGLWDWDLLTNRVVYSREWKSQLGYEENEIANEFAEWESRVHPDDLPAAIERVNSSMANPREPHETEFRMLHSDGSWRWIYSRGEVFCDADGKPVRMMGCHLDITERKQAEEALHSSEEQLRQSQKMEAIGRLAGGVAHDFNNLLTVIIGYSQLLIRELGEDSPMRGEIEEIEKAGNRAAALTNQLLAFSRRQILQPKVLDLNSAVADIEKMLGRLIGEDIQLVTTLDPALGRVKADPGQIEQIIMNLAVNARDAMPNGGKLIIETANVDLDESCASSHIAVQSGQYVMLSASDTGDGMDKETRVRVFEPFFTTKEQGTGTGLGLSTVYGIVKQSGGNIWVYSEPGKGTTFNVYLPRVEESSEILETSDAIVGSLEGTETVLLVEDEEVVRKLARQVLEMNGYTVFEAVNGDDAVLQCQQYEGRIHLVITDMVMPGMSGRQLAERLALLGREMKILFMSGYTDDAVIHHRFVDDGMPFLQKPFTPTALARKVREVLGTD